MYTEEFERLVSYLKNSIGGTLGTLEKLKSMREQAQAAFDEAEGETRDILHFIELEEIKPGDYMTIGAELRRIRKRRRDAADCIGAINGLLTGYGIGEENIKALEATQKRLIGFKPVYQHQDRTYTYKYLDLTRDSDLQPKGDSVIIPTANKELGNETN